MTVTEVANALGLSAIKNRKYQIFKTSAIKGDGLDEAMEWYVSMFVNLSERDAVFSDFVSNHAVFRGNVRNLVMKVKTL